MIKQKTFSQLSESYIEVQPKISFSNTKISMKFDEKTF